MAKLTVRGKKPVLEIPHQSGGKVVLRADGRWVGRGPNYAYRVLQYPRIDPADPEAEKTVSWVLDRLRMRGFLVPPVDPASVVDRLRRKK